MRLDIFKNLIIVLVCILPHMVQGKTTIAVLALEAIGINKVEADVLSNRMRSILVNESQFQVLERANMEAILIEQGFQQTGCTSDECLVEAGRLLGVQKMLAGSVGKFGALYTIELRIIDIESGKIESAANYDYQGEMENLLLEGCRQAIHKVLHVYEDKKNYGKLTVRSKPGDADVLIDGEVKGKTPLILEKILPGFHQLKLEQEFYIPVSEQINLTAGDSLIKDYQLERGWGSIGLNGYPEKALYKIADQQGILSQAQSLNMPAGKYVLYVSAPYYYPLEQNIEVNPGGHTPIDIGLVYGGDDLARAQIRQKWLVFGTVTSLAFTVASAVLAEIFYNKYQNTKNSGDAADYKKLTQTFDKTTIVFSALSATVSLATLWNWLNTNRLKNELNVP